MSYQLKSDQGELSTEEKAALSASVKIACEGLAIRKIITKTVELSKYQGVLCTLNAAGCESPVQNDQEEETSTIPGCTNVQVNLKILYTKYNLFILENLYLPPKEVVWPDPNWSGTRLS